MCDTCSKQCWTLRVSLYEDQCWQSTKKVQELPSTFLCQVVDGRVHALGREELLHACQELPEVCNSTAACAKSNPCAPLSGSQVESGVRCPVGSAVVTPAFNALSAYYSRTHCRHRHANHI
eukprot:5620455-Amphidinium_carterae.2